MNSMHRIKKKREKYGLIFVGKQFHFIFQFNIMLLKIIQRISNRIEMLDPQKSLGKSLIMVSQISNSPVKSVHFYFQFVFPTWKDIKYQLFVSSLSTLLCDIFQGHFCAVGILMNCVLVRSCFRSARRKYIFSWLNLIFSLQLARLGRSGIA